eukprot:TRINITY_DN15823_c0_g1_i1.p1 TRINITY_DN15823_c0_g1~~TRINITY_DN15823_c0_g1_i1.p1  ORF type:complete len:146 (-),score=18.06 TRINITY_DN15823_c0_g1_i1:34-471(-)
MAADVCRPAAVRTARDSSAQPLRIDYPNLLAYCESSTTRKKSDAVLSPDLTTAYFMGAKDTNGLVSLRLGSSGNFSVFVTQIGTSFPSLPPSFDQFQTSLIFKASLGNVTAIVQVSSNQLQRQPPTFVQFAADVAVHGPLSLFPG